MTIITRTGRMVKNEQGEEEAEEKSVFFKGTTTVAGRVKLYGKLREGDKIALEAGNLAFIVAKEIEKAVAGCAVRVLSPHHLPEIYLTDKKTDKEDSQKLAHLIADRPDSRLPIVPIPSDEEMERQKVLSSYRREQGTRNQAINRLHALFVHTGITTVVKKDLAFEEDRKETIKQLSELELAEAEHLVACLTLIEGRIDNLEGEIAARIKGDENIARLMTIPGVGPKIAFAFDAHVKAERFANASQVSNYLGLVPRVYMSGSIVRYGRITKRGNGYLRALLVQGAWAITWSKDGGALRERYEYMTEVKGMSKKKAIVAIALRLGELMYTLMKKGEDYEVRHFKRPADKEAGNGGLGPECIKRVRRMGVSNRAGSCQEKKSEKTSDSA
jgi:transposase